MRSPTFLALMLVIGTACVASDSESKPSRFVLTRFATNPGFSDIILIRDDFTGRCQAVYGQVNLGTVPCEQSR